MAEERGTRGGKAGIILVMIIALNVLGFAYYLYFYNGTYRFIGTYMGWPIYRFYPRVLLLPFSLLALLFSYILYFAAGRLSRRPIAISLLFIVLVASSIAAISILYAPKVTPNIILYGGKTDSYIIQYAAAESILHGENPYKLDYRGVLLSKLAFTKYTFIYGPGSNYSAANIKGFVSKFDYPAMAALYYVPPAALHVNGVYWDAIVLGLALWAVYSRLKTGHRYLLIVVFLSGMFTFFGPLYLGDPQTGWVAPLLVAVAYLDNPVLAGVLIGLAASYREQALIFALFLLIFYLKDENYKRLLWKTALTAIITALAVNLPFLIDSPRAYLHGVLIPLTYNLYPKGFGLSSIHYAGIILPKRFYTGLYLSSLLALWMVAYYRYDAVKDYILAFPAISFVLYYRPMPTYYEYFLILNLIFILKKYDKTNINGNIWETTYFRLASYVLVLVLASAVLVYIGSPRRIEYYVNPQGFVSIMLTVLTIYVASILVISHLQVKKRILTVPTRKRRIRLLARFILASLTIAIVVQSLYPSTRILGLTPYFTDYDSMIDILSGAPPHLTSIYGNYNSILENLYHNHIIGSIFYMVPYTKNKITAMDMIRYASPYAREYYDPATNNWSIITFTTGGASLPLLYAPAMGNITAARLLSGLILASGFILLSLAVILKGRSRIESLVRLAILSAGLVGVTMFYLVTPNMSIVAGLTLILISTYIFRDGTAKRILWFLVSFFLSSTLGGLLILLISCSRSRLECSRPVLLGVLLNAIISLLLGGGQSIFYLAHAIKDQTMSAYGLYYNYAGSGPILFYAEHYAILVGIVLSLFLVSLSSHTTDKGIAVLSVIVSIAYALPFCRPECSILPLMYLILSDIVERVHLQWEKPPS